MADPKEEQAQEHRTGIVPRQDEYEQDVEDSLENYYDANADAPAPLEGELDDVWTS